MENKEKQRTELNFSSAAILSHCTILYLLLISRERESVAHGNLGLLLGNRGLFLGE